MTGSGAGAQSLRANVRKVLGGAALLASAQVLSRLIAMVFTLVIARLMSVSDFGTLNFALSMVVIFALVQDLGISRTVVKEIARRPEDAALWIGRLLPAKLVLSSIAAFAMPVAAAMAGYDGSSVVVLVVGASMLPSAAVWLLLENATQGVGAIRLLARVTISNAALQTTLGLAAAWMGRGDPRVLVAAMVVANVLGTVILWRLLVRRIGPIVPAFDLAFSRRTIAASLPYLSVAIAVAAIGRVEVLMLARLAGDAQAGVFAAAFKLFEAALFVLYSTQIAMNPILARLVAGERPDLERWLDWEFGVLAALAVPACAGAYLLAGPLIQLLYPQGYAEAGDVLRVLLSALPIVAMQVFTAGVLVLTDGQRAVLALNLAVIAAQVVLAWALIPRFGALGAALGLVGSQLVAAALGVALISRRVAGPSAFAGFRRMVVVSVAAVAAGWAVRAAAGDLSGVAAAVAVVACCIPFSNVRLLPPR